MLLYSCSHQGLCLEIEQTQQASDSEELERWTQLSSKAREELATLQCILGSMKDNQVAVIRACRKPTSVTVYNMNVVN